nr:hypothetical protein [Tanacetum cinerariifolium]
MANLSEDIQCAGFDTRPPMLDRTDFASWQQRIRLYCRGKENGVNILKSIDEGPYQMGTVREPLAEGTEGTPQFGPELHRVYSDLSPEEKDCTKENPFMTIMSGRFVTAVKLNRGLRDSNYDQLYAYLKQHETHAKENKMMLERFSQNTADPLTLMSNVSNPQRYSPSSSTSSSTQVPQYLADNPHLDTSISPTENLIENLTNTLALLTQSYKTFLPQTNNQLRTSSNARNQATVQDGRVVVQNVQGRQNRGQGMNPRGEGVAGYGGGQNRVGNVNLGQARPVKCYNYNGVGHTAINCTQPKRPQNSEYYKDKMLLMKAQENGVALDAEQLLFLAGGQDNAFDDDVDEQPALTAQTMFMANLSSVDPVTDEAGPSYDSNILSEVQDHDHYQDAVCAHHKEHAMHDSVQLNHVVDSHTDYTCDSIMISYDQYVKDNEVAIGYKNPLYLTRAKQVQPALYNGYEIIKDNHVPTIVHNTEDTLEIAKIIRRKMNDKMKDPECVTRKVKIAPHDYSKENFLATFTPQKQLTPEQIFWSHDLIKLKSEALKEQTTVSRPIKALTVYPPNTPETLVPGVLPTKSQGRQNKGQGTNPRGGCAAGYGRVQNRVRNANPGQARQVKCYNYNGIRHIARNCTQPKRPQNSNYYKDKMLLMQAQENGVALDEEQLLFLTDDSDAFDSDVDEAPTAQTMFMVNLSSANPVYDEAGPSYDSDILSEVHDHDHYQVTVCEHHDEHTMHDNVQLNHIVDSYIDYTSDSNMIPYDQYVKDNVVPGVYIVENSLTVELATCKEQVELYERRARFELMEREQNINEQLRIVITDHNFKEETLKKELHSVKLQLASTINH